MLGACLPEVGAAARAGDMPKAGANAAALAAPSSMVRRDSVVIVTSPWIAVVRAPGFNAGHPPIGGEFNSIYHRRKRPPERAALPFDSPDADLEHRAPGHRHDPVAAAGLLDVARGWKRIVEALDHHLLGGEHV